LFAFAGLALLLPLVDGAVDAPLLLPLVVGAAVVAAGEAVAAGLVLVLVFALGAVPPSQAIPKAPNTKTVESAITFFIYLNSPVFFKD
jgi:hypothetical protein